MESSVEGKLRELQDAITRLLQEVGNSDPFGAESFRSELSRLAGIAFTLTNLLCYGEIERAYQIVTGEPDEFGETLVLTA